MFNFRMNLYPVETCDGIQWNVEYPDIKGVGGAGTTQAEAIADAEENMKMHLQFLEEEGLPLPKQDNTDLINQYSGKFTVRLSKKLHRAATKMAEDEGISLNSFIVEALSRYCGQQERLTAENLKPVILCDFEGRNYLGGIYSNVIRK